MPRLSKEAKQKTALHYAAEYDNPSIVKTLLQRGAAADIIGEEGNTPFHLACKEGAIEVVKILCAHGINLNRKNDNLETGLHLACEKGSTEVVKFLCNHDIDLNAKNDSMETGLHLAVREKAEEIVAELITRGASIEEQDQDFETPLHCASAIGDAAIVTRLCKAGAEVEVANQIKQTPLHLAVCRDAAEILLQFGARLESRDENKCTPLHLACEHKRSPCVQLLLDKGANPNARDNFGRMPRSDVKEISFMLEEKRIQIRNNTINTAVSVAASINHAFAIKEENETINIRAMPRPISIPSNSRVIDLEFIDDEDADTLSNTGNSNGEESKQQEVVNDSLSTDSEGMCEPMRSDSSCDDLVPKKINMNQGGPNHGENITSSQSTPNKNNVTSIETNPGGMSTESSNPLRK